jgi:hypothetical protein
MAAAAVLLMSTVTPAATQPAAPASTAEPSIQPFLAHYTADWKSINVGTSDLDLRLAPTGGYIYTWTIVAHGVFRLVYSNDVVQKSWFKVLAQHVQPEKYRADDGSSSVSIDFDWQAAKARGISEKKPVDLDLKEGTQDVMSIQVEVMLDLENGLLPNAFHILDKDEIKDFTYTREGAATLKTAIGDLETIIVASQRTGNSRILRMWFAPSLGYVPVQAERSRDGKLEFSMRIKTLKR